MTTTAEAPKGEAPKGGIAAAVAHLNDMKEPVPIPKRAIDALETMFGKTLKADATVEGDKFKDKVPSTALADLVSAGVIEQVGAKKGNPSSGGTRGTIKLLKTNVTRLIPGGGSKGTSTGATTTKRKRTTTQARPGGSAEIRSLHKEFADHAQVKRYLEAVTPEAQRLYKERQARALTRAEIDRATKGLEGQDFFDMVAKLQVEKNMEFEDYIKSQFPWTFFEVLGIPPMGTDTSDKK